MSGQNIATAASEACVPRLVHSGFLSRELRLHALRGAHATRKRIRGGFTLIELVITMGVLVLLVLLATQLLKSAATITTAGHKQIDADTQARQVLDRIAVDLAQLLKRNDVDLFAKGTIAPNSVGGTMAGNDQRAFYSAVPGYYPSASFPSPASLVAYRVNSGSNKLERMGKVLLWNGVDPTSTPVAYMPITIAASWPAATSSSQADVAYEVIGSQVFRFEYGYLLTNGSTVIAPPVDGNSHADLSQIAAIIVTIAVIDPKSKVLITDAQIASLAGQLIDFRAGRGPGDLRAQWQTILDTNTTLPRSAVTGIRLYERIFYLSPPNL
jgi:prepilin-type N-terminal cleavage/methylation domain-containing protein